MPDPTSTYTPDHPKWARRACLIGPTDAELAEFFGVCRNTIGNWKNAHPEFAEACRGGKRKAIAKVVHRLYRRACGYNYKDKHYPPDPTAGIWLTKNMIGWRDKPEDDSPDPANAAQALRDSLREMNEADGE